MQNNILFRFLLFWIISSICAVLLVSCRHQKKAAASSGYAGEMLTEWLPSAPVVIYKTRGDYSNLVPVLLNADRTRIVSFPEPGDLMWEGNLMKPIQLNNGFWLDNRGIDEHVAFLNMTYKEYSKLTHPPHLVELMLRIRDREPLAEMYRCGLRSEYTDLIYELNVLIDRGLSNCEKVSLLPVPTERKK